MASMDRAVKALDRASRAFGKKPVVVMESAGHYHWLVLLYRTKALKPNVIPSDVIGNLRMLTWQHYDMKQDLTAYEMRLQSVLDQTFPGFDRIFHRLTSKTALTPLEKYPTPESVHSVRTATLVKLIRENSTKGAAYSQKKADELKAAAARVLEIHVTRASAAVLVRSEVALLKTRSWWPRSMRKSMQPFKLTIRCAGMWSCSAPSPASPPTPPA